MHRFARFDVCLSAAFSWARKSLVSATALTRPESRNGELANPKRRSSECRLRGYNSRLGATPAKVIAPLRVTAFGGEGKSRHVVSNSRRIFDSARDVR